LKTGVPLEIAILNMGSKVEVSHRREAQLRYLRDERGRKGALASSFGEAAICEREIFVKEVQSNFDS
jgi:hypothetical protein